MSKDGTHMAQEKWSDFASPAGPDPRQPDMVSRAKELEGALQNLVNVIKAAGLYQLSKGVELGQTVWYVKASDAIAWAEQVLPATPESENG